MKDFTLTRADISNAIYHNVSIPLEEASELLESIIDHICDALIRGEDVKLAGFGTFTTQLKNPRMGRNPRTGAPVPIPARKVVIFKPSPKLKDRVANAPKTRISIQK